MLKSKEIVHPCLVETLLKLFRGTLERNPILIINRIPLTKAYTLLGEGLSGVLIPGLAH